MGKSKKAAKKRGSPRIVKKKTRSTESDPMKTIERKVKKVLKRGPKSNKELKDKTHIEDKVLTRTLQRLRRRGKLKVIKGRWVLTSVHVCPRCKGKGWVEE